MSSPVSKPKPLCCEEVNAFLAAYGEDELSPELKARFEGHVSHCTCCTSYLDQYRTTIALAKEAESEAPVRPPDELVQMTISFLRERMGDDNWCR